MSKTIVFTVACVFLVILSVALVADINSYAPDFKILQYSTVPDHFLDPADIKHPTIIETPPKHLVQGLSQHVFLSNVRELKYLPNTVYRVRGSVLVVSVKDPVSTINLMHPCTDARWKSGEGYDREYGVNSTTTLYVPVAVHAGQVLLLPRGWYIEVRDRPITVLSIGSLTDALTR